MTAKKQTGVYEWAGRKCNLEQTGCPHDCRYCYAKAMAIRFGRATATSWAYPTPTHGAWQNIPRHRVPGVTMFPTAHDITSANAKVCNLQMHGILSSGDAVLLVSKASVDPLRVMLDGVMDLERHRIEVRVTIGSADDAVLKYWEPGAPCLTDRLAALQWAHDNGFRTSVSAEPMLDAFPEDVVNACRPFVTPECGIWLGRANRLTQTVAVNCPGDQEAKRRAEGLNRLWSDHAIGKLFARLETDPIIHWKDSIRKVVGI